MKTLAVIGCGRIANNQHLPVLTKLADVKVKYARLLGIKEKQYA